MQVRTVSSGLADGSRRMFAGAILLVTIAAFPKTTDAQPSQFVNVSVITCEAADRAHDSPELLVNSNDPDSRQITHPIALAQTAPGIYQTRIALEPGHYTLNVRAGPCGNGARVQLLPGLNRSIVFVLYRGGRALYDFDGYVAGSLPVPGVKGVSIFNSAGSTFHLSVDDGEYYGEGLPLGNYILDIDLGNRFACRLPIEIKNEGTLLNVPLSKFRKCVGEVVHVMGEPERFAPLSAVPKSP